MKIFSSINKYGLLLLAAAVMTGATAFADTKTEGFDDLKGGDDSVTQLPEGWDIVPTMQNFGVETEFYKSKKPSLLVNANTSVYLITPMLEGEFSFWLRNRTKNYQASVIAYTCTYADGQFQLGDKIGEQTLSKTSGNTPTWSQIKYSVESPTRVALLLSQALLDDFVYTPAVAAEGASLTVTGFQSGSTFDFGGVPVSEDTRHTFTMKNTGTETLNVSSVTVTGGYTIVEGNSATSIQPGNTSDIVISTPAAEANGKLEIVSNDPKSPYVINLTSQYKAPAPVMTVSANSVSFGRVTDMVSENITIGNDGDAVLDVTVASDNTMFKATPASLQVNPGETSIITVTFQYDATAYGSHSARITLHPNAGEDVVINASANILDPDMWTEYFTSDELPDGWEAGPQWWFANGVANSKYEYGKTSYLVTPELTVAAGDELTFDYRVTGYAVKVKIQSSKNGGEFNDLYTTPSLSPVTEAASYTIKNLEPGSYRFRFASDDYTLDNFEGFKLNMNAPKLALSPVENAEFGKVTEMPAPKTYTITNSGTGLLNVRIQSSTSDFSVEPATLTDIAKGESKTFDVTFNYDVNNLGEKSAVISVIPAYDESAVITFNASAISKDPNIWEEDFEEGKLPEYWSTTGWTVTKTGYQTNGTYRAFAGNNGEAVLITPRLYATKGQELEFDVMGPDSSDKLFVEYSHDLENWTALDGTPYTSSDRMTFTAPADGHYYLKFQGRYAGVDNFRGFKLSPKTHDISATGWNLPASGYQHLEYSATFSVREMNGKKETATAKLMVNGEKVDETEPIEIEASGEYTFKLAFTPELPMTDTEAKIVVEYSGETLSTDPVNITIAPAMVINETEATEFKEGNVPVMVFNYTAQPGWNVITTPFALTDDILTRIFGPDYLIFEFKKHADGYMDFNEASQFAAGYPYVVLAPNVDQREEMVILKDIKIEKTSGQYDQFDGVRFQGILNPVENGGLSGYHLISNPGVVKTLFVNDDAVNIPTLEECSSEHTLPAFRGYVDLGATAGNVPSLRFIKSDGTVTGILEIDSEIAAPEGIFNINGLKIKSPDTPGIYIINGKKYVFK